MFPQKCVPKILGMVKKSINSNIYDFQALSGRSEVLYILSMREYIIPPTRSNFGNLGTGRYRHRNIALGWTA